MKKKRIVLMLAAAVLAGQVQATELKTFDQRYSYTLGTRMAKMLKAQGIGELDGVAFGAAVADVVNGKPLQMTDEEMTEVLKLRSEKAAKQRAERAAKALEKSKAFMAENGKKPGVTALESGLQYQIIKPGKGEPPKMTDTVKVHYEGHTTDGKKFDGSYDRGKPAQFALKGVVKGFSEALTHMKPGAKWKVFIPPELGYGARGAGNIIGPNEALVFDLELIEIVKPEAKGAEAKAK
ncbi:FKBP-type peptidyl-prolyl cis-trans isomerase [Thiolapillus sp.]|uniref:FKBP-type peptidyl-prolyl cis-trans isomerase n=1 Tax=Thiolapillus sp. TaxID=2017437 RepID=UPI003AF6B2FA